VQPHLAGPDWCIERQRRLIEVLGHVGVDGQLPDGRRAGCAAVHQDAAQPVRNGDLELVAGIDKGLVRQGDHGGSDFARLERAREPFRVYFGHSRVRWEVAVQHAERGKGPGRVVHDGEDVRRPDAGVQPVAAERGGLHDERVTGRLLGHVPGKEYVRIDDTRVAGVRHGNGDAAQKPQRRDH